MADGRDLLNLVIQQRMTREAREETIRKRRRDFLKRIGEKKLDEPPKEKDAGLLDRVTPDIVGLAGRQIFDAIKNTPRGLYEVGKALTLDAKELATEGDVTPERIGGIGKAMGKGVYEDFRHPLRNPGYLLLDLVDIATLGSTSAAKLGRAGSRYKGMRRGDTADMPLERQPLPHTTKPPKEGGHGAPDQRREKSAEELLREKERAQAGGGTGGRDEFNRPITPSDAKIKRTNQTRGYTHVSETLPDGGYYAVNRAKSGEYTVLHFPSPEGGDFIYGKDGRLTGKKKRVSERIGPVFQPGEESLVKSAIQQAIYDDYHDVGRFKGRAQEKQIERERKEMGFDEMDAEDAAARAEKYAAGQEAMNLDNPQVGEWVASYPGKITLKAIRERFGLVGKAGADEARKMQAALHAHGWVDDKGKPTGKTSKAKHQMVVPVKAKKKDDPVEEAAPGITVIAKGKISVEELDTMAQYDVDPGMRGLAEWAERVRPYTQKKLVKGKWAEVPGKVEPLEPVTLRTDDLGDVYLDDGHKRLAVAKLAGLEKIPFRHVEGDEPDVPEAPTDVSVTPVPKKSKTKNPAPRKDWLTRETGSKKKSGPVVERRSALDPAYADREVTRMYVEKGGPPSIETVKKSLGVTYQQAKVIRDRGVAKYEKVLADHAKRKAKNERTQAASAKRLDAWRKKKLKDAPEGAYFDSSGRLVDADGNELRFEDGSAVRPENDPDFKPPATKKAAPPPKKKPAAVKPPVAVAAKAEPKKKPDDDDLEGPTDDDLRAIEAEEAPRAKKDDGKPDPIPENAPGGEKKPTTKKVASSKAKKVAATEAAAKAEIHKKAEAEGRKATREELIVHKTPEQNAEALKAAEKIADDTGKPPTITAIREATGFGQDSARRIQREWADKHGGGVGGRLNPRMMGTSDRDLGINPRVLTAAGIPEHLQSGIRADLKKLLVGEKKATNKDLMYAFQKHLGDAAGKEAFARWKTPRGGTGPVSVGVALKEAAKELVKPVRGGSYLLGIATRDRIEGGHGELREMDFKTPEDSAKVKTQRNLGAQRKDVEKVAVEAPLSNNPIVKSFQLHRYKWMRHEDAKGVARFYRTAIRADHDAAIRHAKYQLRELDRHASRFQEARRTVLTDRKSFLRVVQAAWGEERREREKGVKEARLNKDKSRFPQYVDTTNQLAIIGTLHAKLGYLTPNLIGQAFLITADHYLAPWRIASSMKTRNALFGGTKPTAVQLRNHEMIKGLMHEGSNVAIAPSSGRSAKVAGVHHAMSMVYSHIMDNWFREISFIHEAKRHGFDTPEKIEALLKNEGKSIEVARRANKNIIDFGNLTPIERDYLRRMIFFYPWIKASALYTARFPTQHPVQAAAIIAATRDSQDEADRFLGVIPSYVEGSFKGPDIDIPFFGNMGERTMPDGSKQPRIINPAAASIFSSFGEIGAAIQGALTGDAMDAEQLSDFMSPAASLITSIMLKRDPFTGQEFPPGMGVPDIVLQEALQYVAPWDTYKDMERAKKYESGEADANSVLFPYTPSERLAKYLFGITPHTLNKKEARSRGFAERRGLAEKGRGEIMRYAQKREDLLNALKETGLLPPKTTKLPKHLADAYTMKARREANLARYKVELGRDLKTVDRLYADLSLVVRMGRMPQAAADRMLETVKILPDPMIESVARDIRESFFPTTVINEYVRAVNERRAAMGLEAISG